MLDEQTRFQKASLTGNDLQGNQNAGPRVFLYVMGYLRSKVRTAFPAVILFFYFAFPALARPRSPSFSLAVSEGFLFDTAFGRLNPLPNTADVPEITVLLESRGASFGLSLGYLITDRIELRGLLTCGRSEIRHDVGIGLGGIPLGKTKISDARCILLSANILYYLSLNRAGPFLTVGLGAAAIEPTKLRSRTKLCLNFGAGMRFLLSRRLATFLEIRDDVSFFDYPKDFQVFFPAIYSPDFKRSQHRLGLHAGLRYVF